jgi:prepilin-type N-terminal cleavage/methylation domain-containing protein
MYLYCRQAKKGSGFMKHLKAKSGFTLMEIMVVIIVIAVLASVAGPMIGSITDQGRASATKSKINSLKSAKKEKDFRLPKLW